LTSNEKILTPTRSIVAQRVGNVKTLCSEKSIPLDDALIEELLEWRKQTAYASSEDYVFASWKMTGKQPYWMSRLFQHHIKPTAGSLGIPLKGWHTFATAIGRGSGRTGMTRRAFKTCSGTLRIRLQRMFMIQRCRVRRGSTQGE
jgi:integrase